MILDNGNMPSYKYHGARSMIILHDRSIREFYAIWKEATSAEITLKGIADEAYESLETLLQHVLGAARGYMVWMCEVLELPDPAIQRVPPAERLASDAPAWIDHLAMQWRTPLEDVPEDDFGVEYESRWKVKYCVDAMLEHAVMHPIRHTYQLKELMKR